MYRRNRNKVTNSGSDANCKTAVWGTIAVRTGGLAGMFVSYYYISYGGAHLKTLALRSRSHSRSGLALELLKLLLNFPLSYSYKRTP